MIELKATTAQEIVRKEKDCDYMDELFGGVKMPPTQVYLKSEADKVIALLKDKANYNEYAYKRKSEELADTCRFYEDELRHHKYKRCVAMARIAQDDWHLHNSFYAMGHREFEKRKCEFYEKWRERWLKIAEQFKDKETK